MEVILVCGALISVLVASLFQSYFSRARKPSLLPPGKTGLPLIGESVEFFRDMQNLQVYQFFFKRMTKYSSLVFKTSIFGDHFAVLCGVEGSKLMFSNSNKLVVREFTRVVRKLLFTPQYESALDLYMKPALLRFVKAEGLNNSVGDMDAVAQRQMESWQTQEITMYPSVKRYLFALACRLFLSIEDPEIVEKLYHPMEILTEGLTSLPINLPGTRLNRAIKAAATLKLQIRSIVKHQRSVMEADSSGSEPKNLLSYLIQAHEDDSVVADGIVGMIVGGYETSSSALCMTLKVLTDHPQIYSTVYEENMEVAATKIPGEALNRDDTQKMRYTWNVVREVMRLYPAAPFITRKAIADFKFANFHIPKGYKVMACTYTLHKDPKYFLDPEKFDPSRFDGDGPLPYTYIPFGGGSFMCPGKTYAQLSILVFMHNMVKKFKWESKIRNETLVGIPHPKPAKGLPLHLYPHAN